MRKDIVMDIDSGDVALRKVPPAYSTTLTWVNEDDFFIYGECELKPPASLANLASGIGVHIPRKDSVKPIKIKFFIVSGRGEQESTEYLTVNNIGGDVVVGANMVLISDDFYFRAYLPTDETDVILGAGFVRDLDVGESLSQNEFMLLVSDPSSIYSSPLTGVGIRKFLNGNIRKSNLPQKIQLEYALDGMNVEKIQYNEETDEIITESTEN